jgi:hypothetical protein
MGLKILCISTSIVLNLCTFYSRNPIIIGQLRRMQPGDSTSNGIAYGQALALLIVSFE